MTCTVPELSSHRDLKVAIPAAAKPSNREMLSPRSQVTSK